MILAALELGRRLAGAETQPFQTIHCPEDGAMLVMPRLRYENHEHFLVVLLNSKGKVTGIEPISEGSLNAQWSIPGRLLPRRCSTMQPPSWRSTTILPGIHPASRSLTGLCGIRGR